jgi:two-component system, sensor histidine kinase and response regulator
MVDGVKSRVLVVDDITKNLQVVGAMLREQGYHVMPATSGSQALERVNAQPPDLILLDLMMPEMDGLEVCRRLKSDPATAHIPVIFLTASNEMEHLVQGFASGAVDYVTKPFNAPELLARVRTHLELKHARERLRELNEEKNEFMGIVAHDLRNPLGAIRGYAEMLLEDLEDGAAPASIEDNARRIDATARRMTEMAQQLLDANAIERGEMQWNLQSVPLVSVVQNVVEAFRQRALAKQQELRFENASEGATVLVDVNLLAQVFENLVSNAVKYSQPGRVITVRLSSKAGSAVCEVQDEGPGLSAEDQKKLFGRFARLSAKPTAGENSTGLGLSIVKRLVEGMRGRVWCESELGKGARFFVQFPIC